MVIKGGGVFANAHNIFRRIHSRRSQTFLVHLHLFARCQGIVSCIVLKEHKTFECVRGVVVLRW